MCLNVALVQHKDPALSLNALFSLQSLHLIKSWEMNQQLLPLICFSILCCLLEEPAFTLPKVSHSSNRQIQWNSQVIASGWLWDHILQVVTRLTISSEARS